VWLVVALLRLAERAVVMNWLPGGVAAYVLLASLPGRTEQLRGRVGRMTQATPVRYRDFTPSQEPIRFRVGEDVFDVKLDIPLGLLAELSDLADTSQQLSPREQLERIAVFFDSVLLPESAARMKARLAKDAVVPIGVGVVIGVMQWLMEVFTSLPTPPSSDSAASSSDGGQSSTDGASPTA